MSAKIAGTVTCIGTLSQTSTQLLILWASGPLNLEADQDTLRPYDLNRSPERNTYTENAAQRSVTMGTRMSGRSISPSARAAAAKEY